MNSATGGDILFHFKGDSKQLDSSISKVGKGITGLGKLVGTAMVAGTAVATGAVVAFTKSAIDNFAEFEQLEGGLKAMFQGNVEDIKRVAEASKTAYKDLQMSQNDYLNSFESSYAIIKNGLGEHKDAIEYTNKALQLSSDLFNTYGGSTEQYANAINWALKGTFSYVDNLNLGIKGTQEGFVEASNKAGILGREIHNVSELTSDEILDVIQFYAQSTGAWGKSQQEASTTVMGSLNMVKASWQDLITEFGKKDANIEGVFDNFMTSVETFGSNLFPVLERIINSIIQYLPGIIDKIAQALPGFIQRIVPPLIQSAVEVFKALVNALPGIIKSIVEILPDIINTLIVGLVDIVNALAEALPELIPTLVDGIMSIIPVLIDNLPLFIEAGWKLIIGLGKGILNSIPVLMSYAPKVWGALWNYFKTMPGKMLSIGSDLLKGLWNGINNAKDWVISKIKGLGKAVLKAVKSIFGVHSPSTEFSFIGRMNMLGLKEGMEDLQPEIQKTIDSLFDLSPNLTGTMNTHYSPNVIVNNNVNMKTDPLGQVVGNIKTFSGGAKNDYNYGMGV